jgi:hypothetical protein
VLLIPEILDQLAHHAALRVPQHQPAANLILHAEQVQLAPQLAVIALARLFQPPQKAFSSSGVLQAVP